MLQLDSFRQCHPHMTEAEMMVARNPLINYDIAPALLYLAEQRGTYNRLVRFNNDLSRMAKKHKIPIDDNVRIFLDDIWNSNGDLVDPKKKKVNSKIPRFQTGGKIPGFGGGDTQPALLEKGEYVINKHSTANNRQLLDAINGGRVQRLQRLSLTYQNSPFPHKFRLFLRASTSATAKNSFAS